MRLIRKTGFMLLIDPRPCWFRTAIERQSTPPLTKSDENPDSRARTPDLPEQR
jgi:hypothetical protein